MENAYGTSDAEELVEEEEKEGVQGQELEERESFEGELEDPESDSAWTAVEMGEYYSDDFEDSAPAYGPTATPCSEADDSEEEVCPEDDVSSLDPNDPHQLGKLGERLAARYLKARGFEILERNYRTYYGEADLICSDNGCIVLVEVKTRLGSEGFPEEAVNERKLDRYRKITIDYLNSHNWFENVRLDVIAINVTEPHVARVHHFMGVCEWDS